MKFTNLEAVVLAAGKGTRIKAKKINKVMFLLAGKPMISYTIKLLEKAGFKKIIIVVGFAKESIINYLGNSFFYVEQKKRLGTGDAVKTSLRVIPSGIKNILVINADDSAFYPPPVIKNLIKKHLKEKADLTILTVEMEKPNIARVVRNRKKNILGIVEKQNLTKDQEKIKEVNCGCYCFSTSFLKKFLPKIKKNPLSHEYYITSLIELAIKNQQKVRVFKMNKEEYFQSVNTREQLKEAEKKMKKEKK